MQQSNETITDLKILGPNQYGILWNNADTDIRELENWCYSLK